MKNQADPQPRHAQKVPMFYFDYHNILSQYVVPISGEPYVRRCSFDTFEEVCIRLGNKQPIADIDPQESATAISFLESHGLVNSPYAPYPQAFARWCELRDAWTAENVSTPNSN